MTPPELIQPLDQSKEMTEGERAEFKVIIKGNPKPSITWSKAKASLIEDINKERIQLVENAEDSSYSLVIARLLPSDAGVFTIKAKNQLGEVVSNCSLVVNTFPRFTKEVSSADKAVVKTQVEMGEEIVTKVKARRYSKRISSVVLLFYCLLEQFCEV